MCVFAFFFSSLNALQQLSCIPFKLQRFSYHFSLFVHVLNWSLVSRQFVFVRWRICFSKNIYSNYWFFANLLTVQTHTMFTLKMCTILLIQVIENAFFSSQKNSRSAYIQTEKMLMQWTNIGIAVCFQWFWHFASDINNPMVCMESRLNRNNVIVHDNTVQFSKVSWILT